MPYRRYSKSRTVKRFRRMKRRTGGLSKVSKKQVVSIAKKIIRKDQELKFTMYEYPVSVSNAWTGPLSLIVHPTQGVTGYSDLLDLESTSSHRIGNTIIPVAIQMNYTINCADSYNVFRVILFQWLINSDESPTVGDIVMGTGTANSTLQMYNYHNKNNYKILYDQTHILSTNAGNNYTVVRHVRIPNSKLKIKRWVYEGDNENGFSAKLQKGGIYYMLCSDSTIVPHPTINWSCRLLFTDA